MQAAEWFRLTRPRARTGVQSTQEEDSREGTEPPHVHVRKGDANAKLWLQPVRLAFSEGYNPSELSRIRELTFEHQVFFIESGMSISAISAEPRARALEFIPDAFVVHLLDGRSLTVPLEWFPRLRDATPEQRSHYEFSGPRLRHPLA